MGAGSSRHATLQLGSHSPAAPVFFPLLVLHACMHAHLGWRGGGGVQHARFFYLFFERGLV